jgi:Ca-activated chloride channel family protein
MNFRFADPWMLLTLILIPLWIWVGSSKRFRTFLHFPSGTQLKALPSSWAKKLTPVSGILSTLGLILLIVALARPQTGLHERQVTSETLDIVLAIDTSTSMRAIDLADDRENDRNRLDAVKEVAKTFIKARTGDRLGLIAFAAMPYTESPLTFDKEWLLDKLDQLKTGTLQDGTAVGSALASAVNRLRESEAESKIVILLTDGINNAGDIDPLNAASLAESLGVRVYTIGAGSSGTVRMPVSGMLGRTLYQEVRIPIDTEMLSRVAEITGGKFFRAENNESLEEVFKEIDELERTEVELTEYTLYTEHFPLVTGIGLGLLLLAEGLQSTRLGRALS